MLVEKPFKVGDVIAFRIITGDEIIGEVMDCTDHTVSLKKPCTVGMGPDGKVGLTPGFILGHPDMPVIYQLGAIIATMTPREDATLSYKTFATGIALAAKPGVVLPNSKR